MDNVPPEMIEKLRSDLDEEFGELGPRIAAFARPLLHLEIAEKREIEIGESHFGGFVDVPEGFEWPKREMNRLYPIVQLDLGKCGSTFGPECGWLLVFMDFEGNYNDQRHEPDRCAVLRIRRDCGPLIRVVGPDLRHPRKPDVCVPINLSWSLELPSDSEEPFRSFLRANDLDEDAEFIDNVMQRVRGPWEEKSHLFGYATYIDDAYHRRRCVTYKLEKHNENSERGREIEQMEDEYNRLSIEEQREMGFQIPLTETQRVEMNGWNVLMVIDEQLFPVWGVLTIWIQDDDLKSLNFSNIRWFEDGS